jgi:hypothetical protein
MKTHLNKTLIISAVALMASLNFAQAALNLDFSEVGSSVVVTFSGSYDNWVHNSNNSQINSRLYHSASGEIDISSKVGANDWSPTYQYTTSTNPTGNPFTGALAYAYPDSITGDTAGFTSYSNYGVRFYANDGYVAGETISGAMTYIDTNLSDLMLPSSGSGTIDFVSIGGGPDNVTWGINGTIVPEPSTYAAILGCIVLGVAVIRRRRG